MATETAGSSWAPLRRPVFRALWLAQTGSNLGGWMQTVAAQWFLVQAGAGSAVVAWVQAASLLPVLFLSLIAGVLADRLDRRVWLLAMNGTSAVLALVLTVLSWTGALTAPSLLVMTFLLGGSAALAMPAWQAIQPDLVPREEIQAAASLGSITVNAARAVGPAIAGLLVAATGPTLVFALNAVSFLGVVLPLLRWKRGRTAEAAWREPFGDALSAGIRYLAAGPVVRRLLLRSFLFALPAGALWALLPSAAEGRMGLDAAGYGVLLAMLGVGSIIGALVMPALARRYSSSAVLGASAVVFGLGTAAVAWWPFAVVLPVLLASGVAWTGTLTTLNAAMQLSAAPWVRARAIAAYLLILMGGQGVGAFLWGAVSAGPGVVAALTIAAVLLALVGLSVVVLPLHPATGTLDRSIQPFCAPEPQLLFDPDPTDGPVQISIRYRVSPEGGAEFLRSMIQLRDSRRRTGATGWSLVRSGEEDGHYREEFRIRSWGEYLASRTGRWTGHDAAVQAAVVELADVLGESHEFVVRLKKRRAAGGNSQ
ncbi:MULTISPECIES: MFS transporter [Arthrobacter]|uniref:MFS transporter n=2 Tax=Arthrobacter TaxID=1663 RepID=A0ABU9KFS4_9MICC|nr:MFS transporter [Arthrobacter sp. YJM1]MDP5225729.1 MFS transporter [Arthrobacter sp. YJM1]